MKEIPAKGPQWDLVVLGEWLNGGNGLAGKLGGCSGGDTWKAY